MTLVLHPQNLGFVWTAPTSADVISAEQLDQFDRDGYFLARGLLDLAEIQAVTRELDEFEEQTTAFLRTRENGRMFIADAEAITFTVHVAARSDVARSFCAQPRLASLARDLLGTAARLYWDQAVYKKPEPNREFPWHQDNGYTFVEPQNYLTCWIPLTPATVQNGCPWVVPGVHRAGTLVHDIGEFGLFCDVPEESAVPVEAEPGDVVVFSSLTPHRTGPNTTDEVRKAYIVQYAPDGAESVAPNGSGGWVRTPQNDPVRQFLV